MGLVEIVAVIYMIAISALTIGVLLWIHDKIE